MPQPGLAWCVLLVEFQDLFENNEEMVTRQGMGVRGEAAKAKPKRGDGVQDGFRNDGSVITRVRGGIDTLFHTNFWRIVHGYREADVCKQIHADPHFAASFKVYTIYTGLRDFLRGLPSLFSTWESNFCIPTVAPLQGSK